MNKITLQLLVDLTSFDTELGFRAKEIVEGDDAARKLKVLIMEMLPNTSIRVRSLFNASGEVPMLYASLLRVALRSVQWKKLVRALRETWGLDTVAEVDYDGGIEQK